MFGFFRERRRAALRERPFPDEWLAIIEKNVPFYRRLPEADRRELLGDIQVFLEEKTFEGCGGLELTDEIRVTIAAQACILLLHRENDDFPDLEVILVYPSTYVARGKVTAEGGVVIEGDHARLGESWSRGMVVLAWDSVLAGASDMRDGHNLVLHEFAHQLDQEDGASDGTPVLPKPCMYTAWTRVLGAEYERLLERGASLRRPLIDLYATTNPAEFFAVVTEVFFERPRELRARYPELYEQLRGYYQQDPASLPAR
jgi:Mlc titration factor MtfA (ptsG expression regulator)